MRATKLEAGKTYRYVGTTYDNDEFVAVQVMGPNVGGVWFAIDEDGETWDFLGNDMPEEVGPVCPWALRLEHRPPSRGEWYMYGPNVTRALSDAETHQPEWVLVIEPNPEAS